MVGQTEKPVAPGAAQYDNVDAFAQQRLDFLYQQGRATREQTAFGRKSSYYGAD